MLTWLKSPRPRPQLPKEDVDKKFPRLRFQVFMGIFLGYAGFYLIRNNISTIAPLLLEDNGTIDKPAIGIISNAVLISYGLSKFFLMAYPNSFPPCSRTNPMRAISCPSG